ncbi:MAG: hypothetical protein A2087_13425 [Spirochaetes bacterium GWD1_61_31]|nr:MAG: hypothetical protein A2Y37_02830 [Spirochaetes bacterium GWB1_60_80]OHD31305.1 MAG: hypothetical protein A2004_13705 [Spirochaetes bacterium GWC1_61_12]OHD39491.1 MAG: hypothetical protein A2087_13425 [Spirochaetes bacterium GWD1_61_31]OHD45543.1 MAG: hypothetical protein A2Y35_03100 [Spirochaetes bacterium GWE1_60_18]OHD58116.1 MAG: hypothetical protein A2Y32_05675 [Spirochaetes bacterium GWF1_60_12]HAP44689.1 hypothetical protein [Spirochaetaceae bacterium]
MGNGVFSYSAYESIKVSKGYSGKSREQIFVARSIDPQMDPKAVTVRESRDSEEHPESLSIIVALDVTGSMGMVPEQIVKESLPELVGTIIDAGIPDPQILFLGIGDFVYDNAPLQIGQFESSAELLDRWLTRVWLEGGGGGNNCESYNLAWLVAARHTAIDCWEKRKQKGFVFTIGDEPVNQDIPAEIIGKLTPEKQPVRISSADMLAEARQRYNVYHLHLNHDAASATAVRQAGWRDLIGQDMIILDDYKRIARTIARLVIDRHKPHAKPAKPAKPGDAEPTVVDML